MIDPATVQRIKDTADIVDVVSDYVHLIKRGSALSITSERHPSLSTEGKISAIASLAKKGDLRSTS